MDQKQHRRRINRGTPKSKMELSPQWIEDRINSAVAAALNEANETNRVMAKKILWQQTQMLAIGVCLRQLAPSDNFSNTRELIGKMADIVGGIAGDLLPVRSASDLLDITNVQMERHLSRHALSSFGMAYPEFHQAMVDMNNEYGPELFEPPEQVEQSDIIQMMRDAARGLSSADPGTLRQRLDDLHTVAQAYTVEDEDDEADDDVISAVSEDVEEDIYRSRRRNPAFHNRQDRRTSRRRRS